MTYREGTRKLLTLECKELPRRGGGSHRKWFNPTLSVLRHCPIGETRDLKTGTVRAAMKQPGIEWDVFSEA